MCAHTILAAAPVASSSEEEDVGGVMYRTYPIHWESSRDTGCSPYRLEDDRLLQERPCSAGRRNAETAGLSMSISVRITVSSHFGSSHHLGFARGLILQGIIE